MSIAEYPLRRRWFRAAPSLSRETRQRLRYMEFYLANGRHVRLTCRHFGISTDHLLPVVSPLGRGARRGPTCGALLSRLACEMITDRGLAVLFRNDDVLELEGVVLNRGMRFALPNAI